MSHAEFTHYGRCTLEVESAFTDATVKVTASSNGANWTKTLDSSGKVRFALPNRDEYTVELIYYGTTMVTESITCGFGEFKKLTLNSSAGLSWSMIKAIIDNHKEADVLEEGAEYEITLKNGFVVKARVAAINHDEDYPHQVIFDIVGIYTTKRMNPQNDNSGGWMLSELREALNADEEWSGSIGEDKFYTLLPDEVKSIIAPRRIMTSAGEQKTALYETFDKVWLPREWEAFGVQTYAALTEHTEGGANQFPIFALLAQRIKKDRSDTANYWWLASPTAGNAAYFCIVNASGAASHYNATSAYGVAPCFHIIASDTVQPAARQSDSWALASDERIIEMVEQARAGTIDLDDYWNEGDERHVLIPAIPSLNIARQVATIVLCKSARTYAAGGTVKFLAQFKNSLWNGIRMNGTNTNVGGWDQSALRSDLNSDAFKNAFPLIDIVKPHIIKVSAGNQQSIIQSLTDTFSLFTEVEVFGTTTYSAAGEGTQLDYFKTAANRVKKWGNGGSANGWWLASPYTSNATGFCTVGNSGTAYSNNATSTVGVAPCFAVG